MDSNNPVKDDKDLDYVPITDQAVNDKMEGKDSWELAAMIANHCKSFMERALSGQSSGIQKSTRNFN
jgi:hypothetical protein